MYEYRCTIIKVVDGDTVDVDIDLGFGVWMRNERVRLHGIDTPESRTRDLEEKKYGLLAKSFLIKMLDDKGGIVLKTHKDAEGNSVDYRIPLDNGHRNPVSKTGDNSLTNIVPQIPKHNKQYSDSEIIE